MGMYNKEMFEIWCKAKYGDVMVTSENMAEFIKEMWNPSPDESDSTSNKLLSFGQPVWVSHNQKKWKKEFYIGKLEDRSKPYITVETKEQLNQYRIKEGTIFKISKPGNRIRFHRQLMAQSTTKNETVNL